MDIRKVLEDYNSLIKYARFIIQIIAQTRNESTYINELLFDGLSTIDGVDYLEFSGYVQCRRGCCSNMEYASISLEDLESAYKDEDYFLNVILPDRIKAEHAAIEEKTAKETLEQQQQMDNIAFYLNKKAMLDGIYN